jgi:uncharacterized membrane protein (UPF0136 family)
LIDPRWHIVGYVVTALLLRVVAARLVASRDGAPAWVQRLTGGSADAVLRFAYYVGLPYTALSVGVLPGRYLGLIGLERLSNLALIPDTNQPLEWLRTAWALLLQSWLPDLGRLAATSAGMAILLAIIWSLYRHYETANVGAPITPTRFSQVAYAAIHWAFYRAAVWALTDDLYLAMVGGVSLLLVEAWLCRELNSRAAVAVSLLITTAAIFYVAPNLWLLIPVHWLLARMCRGILARASASPATL